jgi:hypothetical protein
MDIDTATFGRMANPENVRIRYLAAKTERGPTVKYLQECFSRKPLFHFRENYALIIARPNREIWQGKSLVVAQFRYSYDHFKKDPICCRAPKVLEYQNDRAKFRYVWRFKPGSLKQDICALGQSDCLFISIRALFRSIGLPNSVESENKSSNGNENAGNNIGVVKSILANIDRRDFDRYGFFFFLTCVVLIVRLGYLGLCHIGDGLRFVGWCFIVSGLAVFCVAILSAFFNCLPWSWRRCLQEYKQSQDEHVSHSQISVPRKYPLTNINYRGTVIGIGSTQMANVLDSKKQVAIISALADGSSIRSIERITGVQKP